MFSTGFERDLVLHFHLRPEFVGTLYEGIAVFSQDGRFLAANRSALLHLDIDRHQAASATFTSLFDTPLNSILEQTGPFPQAVHQLRTRSNSTVFCRIKPGWPGTEKKPVTALQGLRKSPAQPSGNKRRVGLEELELGDPGMQKIITRVRKVLGHDIPVMLQGASGTGKELFAQAMHHSSQRRNGPFVALNCAALPENLIEAELFGYQDGAFTGARRKGNLGKIRQSDGGTLFLDEIGDMPLQLQARLLRVLQERAVTPLGDTKSYQVDFAVVCATNRKIREEIAAGRFREDLYYRLNGLLVSLPPLKERKDLLALARSIIDEMVFPGRAVRLSQEVTDIFVRYPWPGNIRQMHNVLRTAVVLLGIDNEITVDHLSEDFLEQYQQCVSLPVSPETGEEAAPVPDSGDLPYLSRVEMLAIQKTVRECGGNISAAARKLGICRNTLYRKLNQAAR
jgi:transcriptional regulator with PAS, ATPase and Fis domain